MATTTASALPAPAPAAAPSARPAPETAPLQGAELVLGTIALSLATFMQVLDTTIANVSIPAISGDLGVSTVARHLGDHLVRVANAISVPLTGWLTQRLGRCALVRRCVCCS